MGTERSTPRRDSIHPAIAIAAMLAGFGAMAGFGPYVLRALGLHAGLVAAELLLVTPGMILLALSSVAVRDALGLHRLGRGTATLALLAGGALWAASLGLMNLQFSVWPPSEQFLETFRQLHVALRPRSPGEAVFSVVAIALMPALCEETLFRGIVLPSMSRLGTLPGLLISAGLFAVIHIDSIDPTRLDGLVFHRVPFAFAVGMGLGAIRIFTGSLVPAVLAHTVINTITFATVFLMGTTGEALEEPNPPLGAALLAGGGLAMALLLRALRRYSTARATLPA